MKFKFELGATLKDKITGFKGVAMGRSEYFTGCLHYGLCSKTMKAGVPIEWEWFDESRLIQVGTAIIKRESVRRNPSGPCVKPPQN